MSVVCIYDILSQQFFKHLDTIFQYCLLLFVFLNEVLIIQYLEAYS